MKKNGWSVMRMDGIQGGYMLNNEHERSVIGISIRMDAFQGDAWSLGGMVVSHEGGRSAWEWMPFRENAKSTGGMMASCEDGRSA